MNSNNIFSLVTIAVVLIGALAVWITLSRSLRDDIIGVRTELKEDIGRLATGLKEDIGKAFAEAEKLAAARFGAVEQEFAAVRREIDTLRTENRGEFAAVRREIDGVGQRITDLRSDLRPAAPA